MKKIIIYISFLIIPLLSYSQINLTIEGIDSTVTSNGGYNITRSSPTNLIFRNNRLIKTTTATGYILQSGDDNDDWGNANNLDGAVISGSQFINQAGGTVHGIMAGYNVNYNIKHNYIEGNGYGVVVEGTDTDTWTEGGLSYNVFKNNNFSILCFGPDSVNIYNNTFYSTRASSTVYTILRIVTNTQNASPYETYGTKVKNNIFYATQNRYIISIDSIALENSDIDYNVYYCEAGDPLFYNTTGDSSYSFTEWQALGYDANSVVVNPNLNASLIPTSPLYYGTDLGTDYSYGLDVSHSWTVDQYPDTTLQGSIWQVGAYVYSSQIESILDNDGLLVARFVATDSIVMDSDSTVSRWADKYNSGIALTQSNESYQPKWTGSAVSFDGVNDFMDGAISANSPATWYFVYQLNNWMDYESIFSDANVGMLEFRARGGYGYGRIETSNGSSSDFKLHRIGRRGVITICNTGTVLYARVNNGDTIPVPLTSYFSNLTIGGDDTQDEFSEVEFLDIIKRQAGDSPEKQDSIYNELYSLYMENDPADIPTSWHVSPDGNDNNPGTIDLPWKTFAMGFNSPKIQPGDTVWFHDGVYYKKLSDGRDEWYGPVDRDAGGTGIATHSRGEGRSADSIVYFMAYPGANPILDCDSTLLNTRDDNYVFNGNLSYSYVKGLAIRNNRQYDYTRADTVSDVSGYKFFGDYYTLDQCKATNIWGTAFEPTGSHMVYIINCDSWANTDSIGDRFPDGSWGTQRGNDGYGFGATNSESYNGDSIFFIGCRAWENGDDGWATFNINYVSIENCWSFDNGVMSVTAEDASPGVGNGWKYGFYYNDPAPVMRDVRNSVAAFNRGSGMTTNDNNGRAVRINIYNNILYKNGHGVGLNFTSPGVYVYETAEPLVEPYRVFKNNLSIGNYGGDFRASSGADYTSSNNTWDDGYSVSYDDFQYTDSTTIADMLRADRDSLGNFPPNPLLLKSTSSLIDAGTVNITDDLILDESFYEGSAPNIGLELSAPEEPEVTYPVDTTNIFVSPSGSDITGNGSFSFPFFTIEAALDIYTTGDTIYVRGGNYNKTSVDGTLSEINGSYGNPIRIFNYPNEIPVFKNQSLFIWNSSYYHIKGITVKNVFQSTTELRYGFYFYNVGNIIIENCVADSIGGRGFAFLIADTISVINCDASHCYDNLSSTPGNAGDGFIVMRSGSSTAADTIDYITFDGCRAWNNSDDGWDVHHNGQAYWNNCYAFNNGAYPDCSEYSDGHGFKINLSVTIARDILSRKLTNCFAAYNRNAGFNSNDNDLFPLPMQIYNNTSVYNGGCESIYGIGYRVLNTTGTDAQELKRVFKNNIAFGNTTSTHTITASALATHEYNSWNTPPGKTVTAESFISVPDSISLITALTASRNEDWSLPDLGDYYKLDPNAPTANNLVDAGTDVGLDYQGDAPDLGAFEYTPASSPSTRPKPAIGSDGKALIGTSGQKLIFRNQ